MKVPERVRVAAAQYALDRLYSVDELAAKLDRWVAEAAAAGAQLLVFPEFAGMEFAALRDRRRIADRRSPERHKLGPLPASVSCRREEPSIEWETQAVFEMLPAFLAVHADLAARYRVYIMAGSLPARHESGVTRNRAYFFAPDGTVGYQDKIVPTRWERDVWSVAGGDEIRIFDTDFGPVGIAICYDVEFPLVARLQAEAGARIVIAPCCCDSLRGYHRVRVGARARALENQAYVIQAPTVGDAPWLGTVGTAVGAAGIYALPDLGPRPNGVVAQGQLDAVQWVYADLDFVALDRIRRGNGVIANEDEWDSHLRFRAAIRGLFEPATPLRSSAAKRLNRPRPRCRQGQ